MTNVEQPSVTQGSIRDEMEANLDPYKVFTGAIVDGVPQFRPASFKEKSDAERVKRAAKARIARRKLMQPPKQKCTV